MTCSAVSLAVLLAAFPAHVLASTASGNATTPASVESTPPRESVRSLFCMTGYRGLTGPGQDIESAVVVVEIDSARMIANATVSDFQLRDRAGKEQPLTHAVSVEIFNRLHVPTEGAAAYYLNPGGTTPWNGTLPAGPIRLRVRYGFSADPAEDFTHFLIKIGPYVIEGPVEGTWPS